MFAPGPDPEASAELAARLRKSAGLPKEPAGVVANDANGSVAVRHAPEIMPAGLVMATTHTQIAASPDQVFAVLANAENYGDWVVGSDTIRDVDPGWPKIGSRFHHRVGFWLLKVNDHTEVLDVDPPRRLVLHARARPFGTARVTIVLAGRDGGTYVTMKETAGDRLSRLVANRLTDPLVHLRNVESLRRLKRIAETGVAKP